MGVERGLTGVGTTRWVFGRVVFGAVRRALNAAFAGREDESVRVIGYPYASPLLLFVGGYDEPPFSGTIFEGTDAPAMFVDARMIYGRCLSQPFVVPLSLRPDRGPMYYYGRCNYTSSLLAFD